jgi:GR25 family glycosyltransferase involved in LPS biosynthesis
MKFYVIHYSKNTDRRAQLEKQLKDFNIEAEWITEYDKEDPIIEKIKNVTNSPLSPEMISCNLKHYIAMEKMVKEDIPRLSFLKMMLFF